MPAPLLGALDYLPPTGLDPARLLPGMRLEVALGRRRVVGVLLGFAATSTVLATKLKPAIRVLDAVPEVPLEVLELAEWAAGYYHHPLGEVLAGVLPVALRQVPKESARSESARARATSAATAALFEGAGARHAEPEASPVLNTAQRVAVDAVAAALGGFGAFLLEGVTGSGKTEVYLNAVERVLARGEQALVLVPEIALTPQLVGRFRARFQTKNGTGVVALHSGLAAGERLAGWRAARDGSAGVVLGTRSAVFVPFQRLGLIIVDEEHDLSYKQQDGLRYHARDLAVVRAQRAQRPVLLGSATPALESLANVVSQRYTRLELPERAGGAVHPTLKVVDVRNRPMLEGMSDLLLDRVRAHLDAGGQVLLFLNRRGYAPRLTCHACGWFADCRRCDAKLVVHRRHGELRCHHCGAQQQLPSACPACASADLRLIGRGTERLDDALRDLFPEVGIARVDRDTTRKVGALDALLDDARSERARILVGTQMLAKGHDFPLVTLVGIVEADGGLFGADFRAAERMAQLITQVAGRAGRAERPGEVLIQTRHPEHPLLAQLLAHGYPGFAAAALEERRAAGLPPFAALALLRAEAVAPEVAQEFLAAARALAEKLLGPDALLGKEGVEISGPAPAPMERRAGRHRAQLLIRADGRMRLQSLLARWVPGLAALPSARKARWALDVDPQELL